MHMAQSAISPTNLVERRPRIALVSPVTSVAATVGGTVAVAVVVSSAAAVMGGPVAVVISSSLVAVLLVPINKPSRLAAAALVALCLVAFFLAALDFGLVSCSVQGARRTRKVA
ncbi:hypothetical protein BC828DRAFT_302985 [Blastocladiella britannica]|nr:hypothetical protein BC828DRAFT_304747 [Blastocladiella britannica]KAI9216494.1 hypothetical protein BC828DRAFT_302985 [Blastocladiella britannica]